MADSKYFGIPFGTSGDKATIPEAVQPSGAISYTQGYGPDYERDPATDPLAKRVPRDETNELYYQVTNALKFLQLYGTPEWYATDDAGNPVSYPLSARVRYDAGSGMQVWRSLEVSNTATPGSDATKWGLDNPFDIATLEATLAEALAGSSALKIITPRRLASATQRGAWNYATAGGTANAIVAALSPAPTLLVAGLEVNIKIATTNTGPVTLNVNALGAVPVVRGVGDPLDAGDLVAGDVATFVYDGAAFRYSAASNVINSAITKTVYGAGADFVDLNAAMAWLARRRISTSGSVTLQIQSGQHISSSPQYLSHPDGARISVVGGRSGAIPAYTAYARNGNSSGQRATDAAANLTMLRGVYSRELRFTGSQGLVVSGQWGALTDILVTGDRTSGNNGLSISGRVIDVNGVVCHGFGNYGITVNQSGYAQLSNCAAVYAGGLGGIVADDGGTIVTVNSCVITGCDQNGMYAVNGGALRVFSGLFTSACNGAQGFNATGGGLMNATAGTVRSEINFAAGFLATGGSRINVPTPYAGGNGIGFYADQQSLIYAAGANGTGNTNGFSSYGGSYIINTGSTLTGASTSPAVNVVGNNNSYILN